MLGDSQQIISPGVSKAANISLSNLENVSINADLIPDTDSLKNLGNSTLAWANLYLDNLTTVTGQNLVIDPSLNTIIKGSTSDSTTELKLLIETIEEEMNKRKGLELLSDYSDIT